MKPRQKQAAGLVILVAVAIALVILQSHLAQRRQVAVPLDNPGFEGGTHRDTLWWNLEGGPYTTEFGEINPPMGWTAWWIDRTGCEDGWWNGRPEVRLTSHFRRVRSGNQALMLFTFWRCHHAGLFQRIAVMPDERYTFTIYGHSWYSKCDTPYFDTPMDDDCVTPIYWAHDYLSVGIDPTGGIDPRADSVVWGAAREIYGGYDDELLSVSATAQASTITVFLRAICTHPFKHGDVYFDDAELTIQPFLPIQLYLPIVAKEE